MELQQAEKKKEEVAHGIFTGSFNSCSTCYDVAACPNPIKFLCIACGRYRPHPIYCFSEKEM